MASHALVEPGSPRGEGTLYWLVVELFQRCSLDGLQLDDHFAWPVEFGYYSFMSNLYIKQTVIMPHNDHTNRYWMRWLRRHLTGLLRDLHARQKQEQLPHRIRLSTG